MSVIVAENLSKLYVIGMERPADTLRDRLITGARKVGARFRRSPRGPKPEHFWALRDISFQIAGG
jgi:hypothetical protein